MGKLHEVPPGRRLIFRPFIHLKDGTILWAKQYGLKAWPIVVKD